VSARTVQRTRSNQWRSSVTTCTTLSSSTNTKDPSASIVTAPLPTLVVRLGGGVGARFVLAQAAPPAPLSLDQPRRPEPKPVPTPLHLALEETDRSELLLQVQAEPEEQPAPSSNRIEMIIDSLPHHQLIEPIPIAIDPLGDSVFTASMRNVDIAATGNSVGEALLLLKEHIDATFEELNRQLSHLTYDQTKTLQMLHTYIAPQGKKSRWL
jgi:hypothetical protein